MKNKYYIEYSFEYEEDTYNKWCIITLDISKSNSDIENQIIESIQADIMESERFNISGDDICFDNLTKL